jgi:hypothetical protein
MPTHFGPAAGPRQGEGGRKFENVDTPKWRLIGVSYLTNREQLAALLPAGMGLEVGEEPIVTIEGWYATEIEWLAGRGYNTLGVSFPVVFDGEQDHVSGSFLTVLWENMCDPILTGRDELGYAKIYCELPEPRVCRGETHCFASWMGFKFLDLKLSNMQQLSAEEMADLGGDEAGDQAGDGVLHHKYIPKTGEWGTAEVSYITLTPAAGEDNSVVDEMWLGDGSLQFYEATWEDMPTQFHIVNALRDLEIKEYGEAWIITGAGGRDLSDMRILR